MNRILQSIAQLLHLAGCTMACLHPDPLSSFTARTVSLGEEDDDNEDGHMNDQDALDPQEQKGSDFGKYAEAYYATLNVSRVSLTGWPSLEY